MLNPSETTTILFMILVALGILTWGYNRAKSYGKSVVFVELQLLALIVPWLVSFGLFAAGIYLNLVAILFLLVTSLAVYIYLGKRLRAEGQDVIVEKKAADNLQEQYKTNKSQVNQSGKSPLNSKLKIVADDLLIYKEDLKLIKSIFGIDTFFATETISYQKGAIFKGNLRGEPDTVYDRLSEKLKACLFDKYRLFLVEGTERKPVVIVLPSIVDPRPTTFVQKNVALVLFVSTILTSLEASGILLGFDLFSDWSRYKEAIPLSLGLWTILIVHEISHRLLAKRHNVRLSVPFFLPTWQIGSFGAITRFESLLPNRNILFDVAFAGSAAGWGLSLVLLTVGLVLSHPGSLFQVPTQFFQGSILVGSLARVVFGEELQKSLIDVHPLTIIGWLGLVISALNLLPAGQLDGGRIVQAIYGRKTAKLTTIVSLIVLGIVTLINPENSLPLYWIIVILFLQLDLERPSLNELTEPDNTRATWGLLILFLMLVTLIPWLF